MKVLLVEDDPVLLSGIAESLRTSGAEISCAEDGNLADHKLKNGRYDLVVLDLGLPLVDGSTLLRRLRRRVDQTPVVIISARDGVAARIEALNLGADDYLVKPFSLDELEARIRAVLRRKHFSGLGEMRCALLRFSSENKRAWNGDQEIELSARELQLLETLLANQGRVLSKEQLLDIFSDNEREIGFNAIEVYVHRLRPKLEGSGTRLVTLRGIGYLLDAESA